MIRDEIQFGSPAVSLHRKSDILIPHAAFRIPHLVSCMPHLASLGAISRTLPGGLQPDFTMRMTISRKSANRPSGWPPGMKVCPWRVTMPNSNRSWSSDFEAVPRLYGRAGETPDHRLPGPGFTVRWSAQLLVRFEATYEFTLLRSSLEDLVLTLDGKPVLLGESVELESGPVMLSITGMHRGGEPAFQLWWRSNLFGDEPIAARFFGLPDARATGKLATAVQRQRLADRGAVLAETLGCARCHRSSGGLAQELAPATLLPGPRLDGLGSRLHRQWLVDWLKNPHGQREGARMPALFDDTPADDLAARDNRQLPGCRRGEPRRYRRGEPRRAAGASVVTRHAARHSTGRPLVPPVTSHRKGNARQHRNCEHRAGTPAPGREMAAGRTGVFLAQTFGDAAAWQDAGLRLHRSPKRLMSPRIC